MARPLSNDLRMRLIKAVQGGMSARAAGRKLDIPASTATGITKHWRDSGSYEPFQMGGYRRPVLETEQDFIESMLEEHGDWSEAEMAAYLEKERGVCVHPVTVGRFIRSIGWRYKKNGLRVRTGS